MILPRKKRKHRTWKTAAFTRAIAWPERKTYARPRHATPSLVHELLLTFVVRRRQVIARIEAHSMFFLHKLAVEGELYTPSMVLSWSNVFVLSMLTSPFVYGAAQANQRQHGDGQFSDSIGDEEQEQVLRDASRKLLSQYSHLLKHHRTGSFSLTTFALQCGE
jgi:hypothetical protein